MWSSRSGSRRSAFMVPVAVVALLVMLPSAAWSAAPTVRLRSRRGEGTSTVAVRFSSRVPIGVYMAQVVFDPLQVRLEAIDGGTTPEFSGPPLASPGAFASGTVKFGAFQASRLDGPTKKLSVATLTFRSLQPQGRARVTVNIVTFADTGAAEYSLRSRRATLRLR